MLTFCYFHFSPKRINISTKGDEMRSEKVGWWSFFPTMNGSRSLDPRVGSYGSLHSPSPSSSSPSPSTSSFIISRKPSSKFLALNKDKERWFFHVFRRICRAHVAMCLLVALALLVFVFGSFAVSTESTSSKVENEKPSSQFITRTGRKYGGKALFAPTYHSFYALRPENHPCRHFAFPPPPPLGQRRPGPRPCDVCYVHEDLARASMPSSPSVSPVIHNLMYVVDESPAQEEGTYGGSDFGGYPTLQQRNESFDVRESMRVHCGFVKGIPGRHTGFDISETDLEELQKSHDVIVASAIFGNYDEVQHPVNISEEAQKNVPFYMFIDEKTEAHMTNAGVLDGSMRVGLWKIIVVRNIPYKDARRNGKIPKLLLHRILPNVRYSIWIDGKLKLLVDPYKVLERFLWRKNANFAISRHYKRFDVFEEAEANKVASKYDNASIDYQIEFYRKEGLTPYSEAKLPITSDVPEGCAIIREHVPVANLFTCLWFNEVDRFTSRDQLSFSTVRDALLARVNWSISMFEDCERRNFVYQAQHREYLELMRKQPPPAPIVHPPRRDSSPMKSFSRHGKERRSGARRHRKAVVGDRDRKFTSHAIVF